MISETSNIFAKGVLRLYDKNTGEEYVKKNLVVNNSAHVHVLALGGDVSTQEIRFATWGDVFPEDPSPSTLDMDKLEADTGFHLVSENHTLKTINVLGHSYPATRSIKFVFEIDRNNANEFVGKNLKEWGLLFNGILFSRVALETDFIFQNYMTIVGEWTIVMNIGPCGYANPLLNQYNYSTIWGFFNLNNNQVKDLVGDNNLIPYSESPILSKEALGEVICSQVIDENDTIPDFFDVLVEEDDTLYLNSAPIIQVAGQDTIPDHNVFYVLDENQKNLDLTNEFSLWSWFKTSSCEEFVDGMPKIIFSKWMTLGGDADKSYRLYVYDAEMAEGTIPTVRIVFEFNDGDSFIALESEDIPFDTIYSWTLVNITLNPTTRELKMFVNGEFESGYVLIDKVVGPTNETTLFIGGEQLAAGDPTAYNPDTVFTGMIDETGFSPEFIADSDIARFWNDGIGDFYRV